MRTLYTFAAVCLFGTAFAALLPACGSSDDPSPGGSAGASPAAGGSPATAGTASTAGTPGTAGASSAPPGDAAMGATIYTGQVCNTCHGPDGSGNQGPNITLSTTAGIGSWTYQQFHDAVRLAKRNDGTPLCVLMLSYNETDISEQGIADLYAFLKSQPINDTPQKGSYVTSGACQ